MRIRIDLVCDGFAVSVRLAAFVLINECYLFGGTKCQLSSLCWLKASSGALVAFLIIIRLAPPFGRCVGEEEADTSSAAIAGTGNRTPTSPTRHGNWSLCGF